MTMRTMLGLVLLLASSILLSAKKPPVFRVLAIGEMKVNLFVDKVGGKATAFIINENQQVIHRIKRTQDDHLNLTLDFSELNKGQYQIVFQDEIRRRSVPVILQDDTVLVNEDQSEKVYFPQLVRTDDIVLIKLISDEKNDLSINIMDKQGNILINDVLKGERGLIGKRFKFEQGNYIVRLKSKDYEQTKYLSFK